MLLVELFEDVCSPSDRIVTYTDLKKLEEYLDQVFRAVNIDINITGRHFIDRLNDDRNGRQISVCELRELFRAFFREHQNTFKKFRDGFEAVLFDLNSTINLPFMIKFDRRNKELDLVAKSIMRKPNYMTDDPKLRVNSKFN